MTRTFSSPRKSTATLCALALFAAILSAKSSFAADLRGPLQFSLKDQNGSTFTERDLTKRPSVVHFGFANCPVICPTTLYEVAQRMRQLGPVAEQINFVFVTVDPQRDTPEFLKTYVANFDARITALTGDAREIAKLAATVGAVVKRVDSKGEDYTFDHSAAAFVIGTSAATVHEVYMGYESKADDITRQLQSFALTGEWPNAKPVKTSVSN